MRAAIYPRYSTDQQRPTSIEDQVRRCRELAAKENLGVEDDYVFPDSALSGHSVTKRIGFQRLLDAWDAGLIDMVFADEVSRFARDMSTGAMLIKKVNETGVHVITGDGIDTRRDGWELLWSFKLVQATSESKGTAHRVVRGMQGQLERGYMIAQAAFGYKLERTYQSEGNSVGTRWVIDPPTAQIVRDMYSWRFSGMSVAAMARRLNEAGIPPPRGGRKGQPGYWRPGSVYRLLSNMVYRGVFQWNGSSFTKAKSKKRRRQPVVVDYARPDLRLVDDDIWYSCNPTPGERAVRGGGKHVFAGLLECSACGASLTVGGGPTSYSLHCAQCDQAHRVGARDTFLGYTSVAAARQALLHTLRLLFTGRVVEEFRARLRARLHDKPEQEEARLRSNLTDLQRTRERLLVMLRNPDIDVIMLEDELTKLTEETKRTQGRLAQIEHRKSKVSAAVVEAQCAVDPVPLLETMLDGQPQSYQVRATLRRLVRRFVFLAKPARYHAVFEIEFAPGALVAEVTDTSPVDEQPVRFHVEVKTSACRPPKWTVEATRMD